MEILGQIKEYALQYEKEVRRLADELRSERMPQPTEALFREFETCGNRIRYESVYFGRRKFLSVLGLASVIWHEKEDIRKLEEVIKEVCLEECWALPAHVNRKEDPNWRGTIDLFASETGQALAHLTVLLKDELSDEIVQLAQKEVFSRILTPFMESDVPYAGWEELRNNWNAVCCGNIGSTALLLLGEGEAKKALLERIRYALKTYYLGSFGMDGACQEGLGYWVYGFTYLTLFALAQKEYDPSEDIMALEKTKAIAHFQQKCYFYGGRTVSFSDGDAKGTYPMGLTCCLADIYSGIRFPDAAYAQKLGDDNCWRWIGIYWNWYWTRRYLEDVEAGKAERPQPLEEGGAELLKDAEWCILKGAKNSAVIAKGGNNGESHNHNDVGSFYYLACGEAFLDDLGAGEYTKDYFSKKRYEIFCNRGESHNIPIIEDVDQKEGSEYGSDAFELKEDGSIFISFAKAYGLDAVQKVYRHIELNQQTGALTVSDHIEGKPGISIWENLITRLPVSVEKDCVVIHGTSADAVIRAEGKQGDFYLETVDHSNHEGKLEKIRVIRWKAVCSDAENGKASTADSKILLSIAE